MAGVETEGDCVQAYASFRAMLPPPHRHKYNLHSCVGVLFPSVNTHLKHSNLTMQCDIERCSPVTLAHVLKLARCLAFSTRCCHLMIDWSRRCRLDHLQRDSCDYLESEQYL